MKSVSIQDMQELPFGTHYYTDGSKSDSRAAAVFIVNKTVSCLRLNDDATISKAELVAIRGALEHPATNKNRPIIHTDLMTAIQILMNIKESERSLCNYIFDTARQLDDKQVINWIPSHVGIEGSELADQYAKEALQGEVIDYHVKGSHLKAQQLMKRTAIDSNSEMVKNCGTWTFSFNKQLQENQQKFILNFRGDSRGRYIKSD